MENDDSEIKKLKMNSSEIQKLLEDREKTKQYIKSCKELIAKQSEQLKAQQANFKETLSNLESQQVTSRFHAVGIKLELEAHKIYMTFYKKYKLLLSTGFYRFKFNTSSKNSVKKYVPIEIKNFLRAFCYNFKKHYKSCLKHYWKKYKDIASENSKKLMSEIERLEKENKEIKFRIAKSKAKTEINPAIQGIIEENKHLQEKIKNSEESVELFIKEMSNLLDKHEPPGFREQLEKYSLKNKRPGRVSNKGKNKNSPDHGDLRKSLERKLYCD